MYSAFHPCPAGIVNDFVSSCLRPDMGAAAIASGVRFGRARNPRRTVPFSGCGSPSSRRRESESFPLSWGMAAGRVGIFLI
ncbi:hypothetical protein Sfum_2172 [Syntrophobacter fumaroxidans MPOB]|uniref:Uncharacterized protein n=1 Tax=Syntrophobacter fumaroxidans (strain DSM 10017 / MPOB) TaxID=335543 RepID=A0LKA2_SYNFM|nr:hypothetical protein Sfum_2172 [Syntrophobacter fumaroxidans MPOB]